MFSSYLGGEKLKRLSIFAAIVFIAGSQTVLPAEDAVQSDTNGLAGTETRAEVPGEEAAPAPVLVRPDERSLVLGEAATDEAASNTGVSAFAVIRMVLALALAAAAIYGVAYLFKRGNRAKTADNPHLKVLSTVRVGPSNMAAILSVGTKAWLVGSGEKGLSLIAEITEQEAIDAMLLDESVKAADSGSLFDFGTLLRRVFPAARSGGESLSTDNLRRQRERLKGL
jgi:flagellar protein FliO/FliZ